ncbi:MAG: type III-B CRISPR module RAMP protein Cmr6, partial [Desulfamplus sp.]|nr:type III-B CRISPR module RAMP protein Cmr6 [Desulfamplus sp.]
NAVSNFGLYFQKFCRYQKDLEKGELKLKAQKSWHNGQTGGNRINYEWSILENQKSHAVVLKNAQPILSKLHERQTLCLESYAELGSQALEISATSETPLLTGIGETSPTEVGMVFDRNMGIPYLPASSIKGAVRYAYCVNFANAPENVGKVKDGTVEEQDVTGLVELFGGTDANDAKRGGFAFMDAYSETVPDLKVDIMNPHHGNYYQNKTTDGPVETELPVPIKFLVVEKGSIYKFRGFFLNDKASAYKKELIEAFKTALTLLGLGAKTAVGYGRFGEIKDTTESCKQKAKEIKEREKQELQKKIEQDEAEKRADAEKKKAAKKKKEAEDLRKKQEAQKAAEAEALEKELENAEGIEKDILLMKKEPTEENAIKFYDKHIQQIETLDEKEKELALLIRDQFASYGKKTKENKLKRKNHVNLLLKKSG